MRREDEDFFVNVLSYLIFFLRKEGCLKNVN